MTTEQKEKFLSNQNLSQKFTEEFAKWELNPAVTAISLSVSNFFTTVAVFYKTEEDLFRKDGTKVVSEKEELKTFYLSSEKDIQEIFDFYKSVTNE